MFDLTDTSVVTTPELFSHLTIPQVVLLDGDMGPLSSEQEKALCTFVERGGGLVCLGDAVEVYAQWELLGEVLGHPHGICTARTEIIAHVATTSSFITRRVDLSFA